MKIETTRKLSWFGKFQRNVNRLKGPSWVWYALIAAGSLGIGVLILGISEGFSAITLEPIIFLALFQIGYVLSLMDLLDKQALVALENFQQMLLSPEEHKPILESKLTFMEPKAINRITLLVSLFFLGLSFFIFPDGNSSKADLSLAYNSFTRTPFGYYSYLNFYILWLINIIFIYHTIKQIKAIKFAFSQCTAANIFNQNGLHSFTKIGASTGIGLVLSSPIWLLLDPGIISLGINVAFSIAAIAIFVLPLQGIHNLLMRQKLELLTECQHQKEEIIRELFSTVESKEFNKTKDLESALSAIISSQKEIQRTSTWPWDTETIRRLAGAILFPISIWLIQYFLSQLLAK